MHYAIGIQTQPSDEHPRQFDARVIRGPAWTKRLRDYGSTREAAFDYLCGTVRTRGNLKQTFSFTHTCV